MKVVLLTRVSSKDRQDVERQIRELTDYCQKKNWEPVATIRARVSASKKKIAQREDIKELVNAILQEKPDKVLVTEISRAARDPKELDWIINFLSEREVSFYLKNYEIETLPEDGKMATMSRIVFGIVKELALMEVEQLSVRIISGLDNARKKGIRLGRPEGAESPQKFLEKHRAVVKRLQENPDMSNGDIAKLCGVSKNTVQKVRLIRH